MRAPRVLLAILASLLLLFSAIPEVKKPSAPFLLQLREKGLYLASAAAFGSISLCARLGSALCLTSPWNAAPKSLWLLASHISGRAACSIFSAVFKSPDSLTPPAHLSWHENKLLLSEIPVFSKEDEELLLFLERRWLAKSCGSFSFLVDRLFPCFGIFLDVHPETTNCYSRNPSDQSSLTYKTRVEAWKRSLPHPEDFPLILTRPADIRPYLPRLFEAPAEEGAEETARKLLSLCSQDKEPVVIDLTKAIPPCKDWTGSWEKYQASFIAACRKYQVDLDQTICIQTTFQEGVGALRLLPLSCLSKEKNERLAKFLADWIGSFGLSANRVELDRSTGLISPRNKTVVSALPFPKEEFLSFLDSCEQRWNKSFPQKTVLFQGTLQLLRGLCAFTSSEKWDKVEQNPARQAVAYLSFSKIKEELSLLCREEESSSFLTAARRFEKIHCHLSSLLEIFSPFAASDFPAIYSGCLPSIPACLQPITSFGLHSSGMTSIAGIFKAAEKALGKPLSILYGENAYFECVGVSRISAKATSIEKASEEDWKNANLILAQFNPALKRVDALPSPYRVERVGEIVRKALELRNRQPLIVAIDSTFDFIDSPKVALFLEEFQEEIASGVLCVVCYRSGLKFDMFGMDNYCGAPFFTICSQEKKWGPFNALTNDPALQTDLLSANWFCLAYASAAQELEEYRRQIFDNTRALLDAIPLKLLEGKNTLCRVMPVDHDAEASFLDIRVAGPFHRLKGSGIVAGMLTLKCLEKGYPLLYRASVGFYHSNLTVLFNKECTTLRLTLGLDPQEVKVFAGCFQAIANLPASEGVLVFP